MAKQEKVFSKAFETAELAKLNDAERSAYEDSLKYYRDVKNSLDTAKDEGREAGIEIGKEIGREEGIEIGIEKGAKLTKIEGIKRALQRGKLSIEEIAEDFDVSVEFVLQVSKSSLLK
jgi:predicted transposase YdaD